jgi:hypothetical protein
MRSLRITLPLRARFVAVILSIVVSALNGWDQTGSALGLSVEGREGLRVGPCF